MITYLIPRYDSRKSFYNKAIVSDGALWQNSDGLIELKNEGIKYLYSYNTCVCYIDNSENVHLLPHWNYSATTLRHVKEFLKQNNFKAENKKQIEQDYFNN